MVPEVENFEPMNAQDDKNVQEEMKLAEAISPSPSIEHQESLAQPPEEHKNSPSNTSFKDVLANGHSKIDLAFVLRDHYAGDTLFHKILIKPKDFQIFEHQEELIHLKLKNQELLCISDYMHKGQSVKEIVIDEAHSLLAHLGTHKTLAYL